MNPEDDNVEQTNTEANTSDKQASLDEILRYDAFSEENVKKREEAAGEGEDQGAQEGEQEEEPAQQTEETVQEAKPRERKAAPAAREARTQDEQAQSQAQSEQSLSAAERAELVALRARVAQQAAPAEQQRGRQEQQERKAAPFPDYNFGIPDELLNLLSSENIADRRKGLGAALKGVAMNVHAEVRKEMESVLRELPRLVDGSYSQRAQLEEAQRDFYGTYKGLDHPSLRPLVMQIGSALVEKTGATAWSPQLRDAIAVEVAKTLQWSLDQAKGVQPQRQQQRPANMQPRRPPAMMNNSSRSGSNNSARPKTVMDELF